MLIAYDKPGQLGNQFWAYSNLIAIAVETDQRLIITFQDDYYDLLDSIALNSAKKYKIEFTKESSKKAILLRKIILLVSSTNKECIRALLRKIINISIVKTKNPELVENLKSERKRIFLINSWENRSYYKIFLQKKELIHSIIKPDYESKRKAEIQINTLRSDNNVLIAVHIRKGDYKSYLGGKHYFENDIYKARMLDLCSLLKTKIVFVIFSNEKIECSFFKGLNISFDQTNTSIGDMWGMGMCDYIIGPVSTFSMWASYWNQTPIHFLDKETSIKSMNVFSPYVAQDLQLKDVKSHVPQ